LPGPEPRTITVEFPPFHPGQLHVLSNLRRFNVIAAGRRWRKTSLGTPRQIKIASQGGNCWWIAPSYDIAEIAWDFIAGITAQIPGATRSLAHRRADLCGGWVQVKSADSEGGLRGRGLDDISVDETAHISGFKDIWEQELRPALADKKGTACFFSTPKGLNYFYELFKQAEIDPELWASFQMPSWTNPHLDPAEIEAARKALPALVFRQEFGAEFVQLAGAMFKREYFEIVDKAPALSTQARHWDLAASTKTQADRSAGARLGLADDGTVYVLDCIADRWEWPGLVRIIGSTARSDGSDVAQSVETTGTQKGMLQLLQAEPSLVNVGFKGVSPATDKITRANPWLARAEQGKVKLVRGEWNGAWLDEVCSFPEGDHDDRVDATSGAFAALAEPDPWAALLNETADGK
jgi:predicted phage terminase large subunit-like protein